MIYSISLLNKHLYFWEVHCTTLYKVLVFRLHILYCSETDTTHCCQPCWRREVSWDVWPEDKDWRQKAEKYSKTQRLEATEARLRICIHGSLQEWRFIHWSAEPCLRFIMVQPHIQSLKGQRDWKPHNILPVHTDSFSFKSRIGWDRAQLWRPSWEHKAFVTLQISAFSYYFLLYLFIVLLKSEYIFCCGVNKRQKIQIAILACSLRNNPTSARNSAFLFCHCELLWDGVWWSPPRTQLWAGTPRASPVRPPRPPPICSPVAGQAPVGEAGEQNRKRRAPKHLPLVSGSGRCCRPVAAGWAACRSASPLRCRAPRLGSV